MTLIGSLFIMGIYGCQKDKINTQPVDSGFYTGTFKSDDDVSILKDSVRLTISNEHYVCSTNLPFDYGAGRLEISETRLTFTDTLFFPIPAMYGTRFVLSGEYTYKYDGVNLKLEKLHAGRKLTYSLKKSE